MSNPATERAREYAKRHGVSMTKARRLSAIEYRETRPNHYFYDSLGDPLTCDGDHNHPRMVDGVLDEPAMNEMIRA